MEVGQAAAKAENAKWSKYPDQVRRYRFESIAIETSGVFGPITRNIVHEIGKRISEKIEGKRETTWLKQQLNIAVQEGNALSIMSSSKHLVGYSL